MNRKFHSKLYSTLLTLLLLISLVTTPLTATVYAENVDAEDDVVIEEQANIEESKEVEESDNRVDKEKNAEEVEAEATHSETSGETALEESKESDEIQPKDEIVEFEDNTLREAIKEELEIESDDVTVSDMKKLEYFSYIVSDIRSLKGLEYAINLKELYLDSNMIKDISPLKGLNKLTKLNLSSNKIVNISPLEDAVNLKVLNLGSNKIKDISVLKKLNNLTELDLFSNKIEGVSPLEGLNKLTSLTLWSNQITDISSLKKLNNLTTLYLGHNKITDISPLKGLNNLTELNLDSIDTSDVSALKDLKMLVHLSLISNQITDISPLKDLNNLTTLDLKDNPIEDVTLLVGLNKLVELNLLDAQISDFSGLNDVLKALPHLKTAFLWGNPAYDDAFKQSFDQSDAFELLEFLCVTSDIFLADYSICKDYDEYLVYYLVYLELFPDNQSVSDHGNSIIFHLDQSQANEIIKLSPDQINFLRDHKQQIEIIKKDVRLNIPWSIFNDGKDSVEIEVRERPQEKSASSNTYDFTIKQGKNTISEFTKPVVLTFNVDIKNAMNANNLQVFYLNETTGKWENIGGKYDENSGTVTAETKHFSTFTVFEAEAIGSNNIVSSGDQPIEQENKSDDEVDVVDVVDNESGTTDEDVSNLLPNTATNMYNFMIFGFILLLAGGSIFAMRRFSSKRAS